MVELIIAVALATGISSFCSTTEAMLYSLSWTHIERLKSKGSKAGHLLYEMRTNVEKPITAVLTLNTVANTAGATVAGALAAKALGTENLFLFSVFFTILILIFGEILPKTIGVVYSDKLSVILAYPLQAMILVLSPITYATGFITRLITPKKNTPSATEDDIKILASISRQSGTINAYEEKAIANVLALDTKKVNDVMTPRTVVFSMPMKTQLKDVYSHDLFWSFSRIPVYDKNNEDIVGIVQRRDIALSIREGKGEQTLESIMKPIHYVLENQNLEQVLHRFLDLRQHLFAVLDEYGGLAGVLSLEDILEELLGREIVDESDLAEDMRQVAAKRREAALANMKKA